MELYKPVCIVDIYIYTHKTEISPSIYVIILNNRIKRNNHLSSFDTWLKMSYYILNGIAAVDCSPILLLDIIVKL